MKPLEPLEHTAEDALMWAELNWRGGPRFGPTLWAYSLMQDHRDADVMLQAQKPAGSRWCLGCVAGPFCCEQGKPWQCRLRVNGTLRDQL